MIRKLFKWGASFCRLLSLKLRYGKHVSVKAKPGAVYIGRRVRFNLAKNASLRLGDGVYFSEGCSVCVCDGAEIVIGKAVYFGTNCTLVSRRCIEIGEHTLFANNVSVYDHDHRFDDPHTPIAEQGFESAEIRIGKNGWLAANAVVTKGAYLEDHVVLGANAVMRGHAEANSVWGGVPAKRIR